jgi:hypothetical protein
MTTIQEMRAVASRELPEIVRRWIAAGGSASEAAETAAAEKASATVQYVLKSGVAAQLIGDVFSTPPGLQMPAAAWIGSLAQQGAFDRVAVDSVKLPFRTRVEVASASFPAELVDEAKPKGPAVLAFQDLGGEMVPVKAQGMVAISQELAAIPSMGAVLDVELRKSVIRSTDSDFLAAVIASTTPLTADTSLVDVGRLLDVVKMSATSRPLLIYGTATVKKMVAQTGGGIRLHPDLNFNGGLVAGIPAIASDALPAGTAVLVDCSQIATNTGELGLAASRQADIELVDSPTQSVLTATGAAMVSAWQSGLVVLRATRTFSYSIMRGDAVASLTGVAYSY